MRLNASPEGAPRPRPRPTLRPGTSLQLIGLVLAIALLVGGLAIANDRNMRERRDALAAQQAEAEDVAERFDQFFRDRFELLQAVARAPIVQTANLPATKAYFERLVADGSSFSGGFSLIDARGTLLALSGFPLDDPPIDLSDRDYVRTVLATGRPFHGDAIIGRRSGDPLLTVAVPFPAADGRVNGVLAGTIRIDLAQGGLAHIGRDLQDAIVLDGSGQVVVDHGTVRTPAPATEAFRTLVATPATYQAAPGADGSGRWALATAAVPNSAWRVALARNPNDVFGAAQHAFEVEVTSIALLAITTAGTGLVVGARLNRAERRRLAASADAERELRRTLQQHDELLGLIAHELRSPLSIIVGNAQLISRRLATTLPVAAADTMQEVESSARRLQRLLENMLVLSRTGAEVATELEPQVLPHVLHSVVEDFRARYPDEHVRIDADPSLPLVLANDTFIDQIVWNLLSNAAKYAGAAAPVEVTARNLGDCVEVTVSDAGPGMADDDIPRIFDPHFRTRAARTHATGLGLGLAVCRRLVELQGGEITARRNEDGGMTFAFTLPALDDDQLPRSA
jgi:signal transduction histidine kinase